MKEERTKECRNKSKKKSTVFTHETRSKADLDTGTSMGK